MNSQEEVKEISGWGSWNPRQYLETYYASPMGDTYETLDFLVDELRSYKDEPFQKAIEFGAGPTLFGALSIIPYVQELHLSDYLKSNLFEINKWLFHHKEAFNWDKCSEYILKRENIDPSPENIVKRSDEVRDKLKKLLQGDISQEWPLLEHKDKYNLVVSLFCADSVTSSKEEWTRYMNNLFSLAAPGGVILIGALRNCPYYRVGDQYFPCANVNEKDLEKVILDYSPDVKEIHIKVSEVEDCKDEGFVGVMFARISLK